MALKNPDFHNRSIILKQDQTLEVLLLVKKTEAELAFLKMHELNALHTNVQECTSVPSVLLTRQASLFRS